LAQGTRASSLIIPHWNCRPDSLLSKASERLADNRSEIERLLQRADIQVAINRLLATLSNDQALFLSDSNEDKHLYLNLISDLVSAAPSTFADHILNVENKPIEVRASFDQGSTPAQFAYHPVQQSSGAHCCTQRSTLTI
jgi:hypothetical protein